MSRLLSLFNDALTAPAQAVEEVVREPRDGLLLLVFLVGVATQALAAAIAAGSMPTGASALIMGACLGAVVMVLFGGALLHLSADLMGGDGRAMDLLRICALLYLPNVLLPPFALVGGGLFELARLGVLVWQVVLLVVGLREVYRFTAGAAVAAVVLPVTFVVFFLPAAALFLLLITLLQSF